MKLSKNKKIYYSILLFILLSMFTIYPNVYILTKNTETVIDNNAKNKMALYTLHKDEYISTTINIHEKLKKLSFGLKTENIKNNITVELSQGNLVEKYEIVPTADISKVIDLSKNRFKSGELKIKLINTSENDIQCLMNYPNITSGYVKLNGNYDINVHSMYLTTTYSGNKFYTVFLIAFIFILIIQAYISYIVFSKELKDNRVYWLSALLFLLICILRFPYFTFWAEPVAETLTIYTAHNLDKSFSIIDMLMVTDYSMTYLSSIINVIGRVIGLNKYLVVYLYMSGIIIACLWLALFTRISLRKYLPDYMRIIITFSLLSLWNFEAFYINSMFTYWGIYFIIFMYLVDLDKFSKTKYILSMILIFLVVNNKMSFIFLIPSAFMMIFYYGVQNKRKLYMQIVIILSCLMNYIVYSILVPSVTSGNSSLFDRLLNIDSAVIKMMYGMTAVLNLQKILPMFEQYNSLIIIVSVLVYSVYIFYKKKNIHNEGYILFVILVAIFMSQYIHVVSAFKVLDIQEIYNKINTIPILRTWYMLYLSVFMLIVYGLYIIYIKNIHKMLPKILFVVLILLVTLPWQRQSQDNNHLVRNDYKNRYVEYYQYINKDIVSIPTWPHEWAYTKNATNKVYKYFMNQYIQLDSKTYFAGVENIYKDYIDISSLLEKKCIISLHNNYTDIKYNYGKVTAVFYDKNGNIISHNRQLNESNYYPLTGSYMSFIFKKPICNIDRIGFIDDKNNPVYVTDRFIMGIAG